MDESTEMQDDNDGDVISVDSEKHRPRGNDVFKIPRVGLSTEVKDSVDFGVLLAESTMMSTPFLDFLLSSRSTLLATFSSFVGGDDDRAESFESPEL